MTPEELSEEKARALLRWARGIAYQMRRCSSVFDEEDLASAGLERAIRMIPRWNPRKGAFSTYMQNQIRGGIMDFLREQFGRRDQKYPARHEQSFTDWSLLDRRSIGDILEDGSFAGPAQVEARDYLDHWSSRLSRQSYILLYCRYGLGMTQQETGAVIGVSEARVCQLEMALRERWSLPDHDGHASYHKGNGPLRRQRIRRQRSRSIAKLS